VSVDTELHEEVFPCRACGSPVFDDEFYCEGCGVRVRVGETGGSGPPGRREEWNLEVVAAVTDRGLRRHRNEDTARIAAEDGRCLAIVCDGVGSTAHPDLAAHAAADAALAVLAPSLSSAHWPGMEAAETLLGDAFAAAQRATLQVPDQEPGGHDLSPSTTMVVAVTAPGAVAVGNIGDSRAYLLSRSVTASRALTVDDSWAQDRISEGVASDLAYSHPDAHIITRWLGGDAESSNPTVTMMEVSEPALLIVCSDGLWNYFEEPDALGDLVPEGETPLEIARGLTEAALAAGGRDNITVAVIPIAPVTAGQD
jgi:serine/threonine protein phosphatase PrpC